MNTSPPPVITNAWDWQAPLLRRLCQGLFVLGLPIATLDLFQRIRGPSLNATDCTILALAISITTLNGIIGFTRLLGHRTGAVLLAIALTSVGIYNTRATGFSVATGMCFLLPVILSTLLAPRWITRLILVGGLVGWTIMATLIVGGHLPAPQHNLFDAHLMANWSRSVITLSLLGLAVILVVHTALKQLRLRVDQAAKSNQAMLDARQLREAAQVARRDRQRQMSHTTRLATLGRLTEGLGQDLGTAMQIILCAGDRLSRAAHAQGLSEDDVLLLDDLNGSCRLGTGLVKQLRLFGGELTEGHLMRLDPTEVLTDAIQAARRVMPEGVTITSRLNAAPTTEADATHIQQVLTNLIINARDAMEGQDQGQLTLEARPSTSHDWPDDTQATTGTVFAVSDTGVGMSPEVLDRVFEPFFTTKSRDRGTGLGLATARGIARRYGGHLTVQSEPGIGTTFSLVLPETNEPSLTEAHRPSTPAPAVSAHDLKVLLLEEDEDVRAAMAEALSATGLAIIATGDESTARAVMSARPLDVICLSGSLAQVDLKGLMTHGRAARPHARWILCSSSPLASFSQRGVDLAQCTVLERPCPPRQLLDHITRTQFE